MDMEGRLYLETEKKLVMVENWEGNGKLMGPISLEAGEEISRS
jgi:hypothetical protein